MKKREARWVWRGEEGIRNCTRGGKKPECKTEPSGEQENGIVATHNKQEKLGTSSGDQKKNTYRSTSKEQERKNPGKQAGRTGDRVEEGDCPAKRASWKQSNSYACTDHWRTWVFPHPGRSSKGISKGRVKDPTLEDLAER